MEPNTTPGTPLQPVQQSSSKKHFFMSTFVVITVGIGIVWGLGLLLRNKNTPIQQEMTSVVATSTKETPSFAVQGTYSYQSPSMCNKNGTCVVLYNRLGMLPKSSTSTNSVDQNPNLLSFSYLSNGYCSSDFSSSSLGVVLNASIKDPWLNHNQIDVCKNIFVSETALVVFDNNQLLGYWPIKNLGGLATAADTREYNDVLNLRFEGDDILWDEHGGKTCTTVDQTYRIKYGGGYYYDPKIEKEKTTYCKQ